MKETEEQYDDWLKDGKKGAGPTAKIITEEDKNLVKDEPKEVKKQEIHEMKEEE